MAIPVGYEGRPVPAPGGTVVVTLDEPAGAGAEACAAGGAETGEGGDVLAGVEG